MYFLKNELELSRVSQNYFQFVLAKEKIYLLIIILKRNHKHIRLMLCTVLKIWKKV